MKKLFFGSIIALAACQSNKQASLQLTGFSREDWIEDSLGCLNYRSLVAQSIVDSQMTLKGKSESIILQLLGHPNLVDVSDKREKKIYYFIEGGFRCDSTGKTIQNVNVPVAELYVLFREDGYCKKVGIAMP